MKKWLFLVLICCAAACGLAEAQNLNCDLREYKAMDGLTASLAGSALQVTWQGEGDQQLRAEFTIRGGNPLVQMLAVRTSQGGWRTLASNLQPEFDVVSGRRRMSEQQMAPLRALKILTPELIAQQKWNAFWDAPLDVPGQQRRTKTCRVSLKKSIARTRRTMPTHAR